MQVPRLAPRDREGVLAAITVPFVLSLSKHERLEEQEQMLRYFLHHNHNNMHLKKSNAILIFCLVAIIAFFTGGAAFSKHALIAATFKKIIPWDNPDAADYPKEFRRISFISSNDKTAQPAYYLPSSGEKKRPLLVSLHTWSGTYEQADPLAQKALENNWNYIHPDFRGKNLTKDACLSEKVIADIDDAINFAIQDGHVDDSNIFVVGVSGGGYTALGVSHRTRFRLKAVLVWVPISDLNSWYKQSRQRNDDYANSIVKCTSEGAVLDEAEAAKRSPINWITSRPTGSVLEIYAGINDGYSGAVPITHALLYFNKIVSMQGSNVDSISNSQMMQLLSKEIDVPIGALKDDGRVVFTRASGKTSIIIFEGGHEMLTDYCVKRINTLAAAP